MDINQLLGLNEQNDLEWYQMVLRAAIVFIAALFIIRAAGMRTFGTRSAFDVVVNITVGAILSRCISGHYPFFPCLLAALTLAVLHRIVAFCSYHSESVRKVVEGDPQPLFQDGKVIEKNKSKNFINDVEIAKTLREENIDNLSKVKSMWFETDGKISIVKKD